MADSEHNSVNTIRWHGNILFGCMYITRSTVCEKCEIDTENGRIFFASKGHDWAYTLCPNCVAALKVPTGPNWTFAEAREFIVGNSYEELVRLYEEGG